MTEQAIRIGTIVPGGGKTATADYIRQILPHGFESFEITFGGSCMDADLKKMADQIEGVLAGSVARISSLGVYGNPLGSAEADKETLKSWRKAIDNAHLFGCDVVCGFTGALDDRSIDENIKPFAKVFKTLARRAADKGVRIAFENCSMGGTWARPRKNLAVRPKAWDMLFDAVDADNVGLEWEPCHQMVQLIDPMPQLRRYVGRMFHLHGKDATVHWDVIRQHGIRGPERIAHHRTPGFGDCNWTDIISMLRMGGFVGSIDIEGWHDPVYRGELEMTGQVHGLNYLKRCRGGDLVDNPK